MSKNVVLESQREWQNRATKLSSAHHRRKYRGNVGDSEQLFQQLMIEGSIIIGKFDSTINQRLQQTHQFPSRNCTMLLKNVCLAKQIVN